MRGAVVPITTMPTGWQLLLLMIITHMVLMMSMAISIRLIETNGSVVSLDADDEDDRHDLMMMMMMMMAVMVTMQLLQLQMFCMMLLMVTVIVAMMMMVKKCQQAISCHI